MAGTLRGGVWQELCERQRGSQPPSLTSPHSGATLQCAHRVMIPNQTFIISPGETEEEIGSQNQKERENNLSGTKSLGISFDLGSSSFHHVWQLTSLNTLLRVRKFLKGSRCQLNPLMFFCPGHQPAQNLRAAYLGLHRNANAHQRDSLRVLKASQRCPQKGLCSQLSKAKGCWLCASHSSSYLCLLPAVSCSSPWPARWPWGWRWALPLPWPWGAACPGPSPWFSADRSPCHARSACSPAAQAQGCRVSPASAKHAQLPPRISTKPCGMPGQAHVGMRDQMEPKGMQRHQHPPYHPLLHLSTQLQQLT